MFEFLTKIFDTSDFPERWNCGQWSSFHGWLHILSDLAVFGAYMTIPFVMLYFLRRRRDIPFPKVFYLFAAFIFACGTVHLIEATIFWWPIYRVAAVFKLLTAIVSWGTVVGLVWILPKAITMRSATELHDEVVKRKAAELQFRALLESAPDAMVITDEENNVVFVNKQTEKLFGYPRGELLGKPFTRINGEPTYGRTKGGVGFPIEVNQSPIETEGGSLTSMVIRDVSERVKFQRELDQEKAKFEAIVNGIPDALVLTDTDRKITYCNPAVEQLFGYVPSELIGRPTSALYDKLPANENAAAKGNAWPSVERQQKPADAIWRRSQGATFLGESVGAVISESDGEPLGYLGVIRDITQRKNAEESMRIQERALQSTVNGIVIADVTQYGNPVVYVNNAAQKLSGFTAKELLGRSCRFLQNNEKQEPEAHARMDSAIKAGREYQVELQNYRKDGTAYLNDLIISPIRNEYGEVTHYVGVQTDITKRKEAEVALQKSEKRFAAFMDNSPFVAWVKDSQGRHNYFSRSYENQIGFPRKDWHGKTDHELWPKEVADSHLEMDRRVLEAGEPITFESNHPLPNGECINWFVVKFPFAVDGEDVLVGGIALDMSKQRRAESERDRFFETSSDMMCIANFEKRFTRVNQACVDILGYSREELLAKPFTEFVHPNDLASTENAIKLLASGARVIQFENRYRCKNGSYRQISWTTPQPEEDAKRIFAVGRDITEKRSLEKRLLNAADNEQKRIAHDLHDGLGQELAGVSMMAESLANRLKANSLPESDLARKIAGQVQASLELTRTLARGLRPVEIDSLGLESALSQMVERATERHGIVCSSFCESEVVPSDPEVATHLYRIVQEALTNAAKHGKPKTIRVSLKKQSGMLELKIVDDGSGIESEGELQEGVGMKSMRYRCESLGGKMLVGPGPSGGTAVTCCFT